MVLMEKGGSEIILRTESMEELNVARVFVSSSIIVYYVPASI